MDNDLICMLQRIVEWDVCFITKEEDFSLPNSYAIDFENESLFYAAKPQRDAVYELLLKIVPLLKGNIRIA